MNIKLLEPWQAQCGQGVAVYNFSLTWQDFTCFTLHCTVVASLHYSTTPGALDGSLCLCGATAAFNLARVNVVYLKLSCCDHSALLVQGAIPATALPASY